MAKIGLFHSEVGAESTASPMLPIPLRSLVWKFKPPPIEENEVTEFIPPAIAPNLLNGLVRLLISLGLAIATQIDKQRDNIETPAKAHITGGPYLAAITTEQITKGTKNTVVLNLHCISHISYT